MTAKFSSVSSSARGAVALALLLTASAQALGVAPGDAAVLAAEAATTPSLAGAAPGRAAPAKRRPATTATPRSAKAMLHRAPVSLSHQPCDLELDVPPSARCGTARVPADWSDPTGETLHIAYVLLPAERVRSRGTVIPFMGGPGESISAVIGRFVPLAEALPERDLLLVDVRGTGRSGALRCRVLDDATENSNGAYQVPDTGECGEQIGPRRDDYTTVASVLDVEAIRRALHLKRPSLIGFSYGTWVAQVYTRLFPHEVRGAVLDGAFPLEQDPWAADVPASFPAVVARRCERTGACLDGPAAVAASIRQVAASLASAPIDIPGSAQRLTEGAFAAIVQFSLQGPDFAAFVATVEGAARGDGEALVALTAAALVRAPSDPTKTSSALAAAVSCNDYVAPFSLADDGATRAEDYRRRLDALPDDAFGWFSKAGWMSSPWEQGDMCLQWPVTEIDAALRVPRGGHGPRVPVLVVNGDIDLQTPLVGARKVQSAFPKSVLVTVPNAAHVAFPVSDCAAGLEIAFLANPTLPDAGACMDRPVEE